ncbi:GNAT family N-acetyltransferase [Granulicella aggregans]|uniref:GNAT family N-acetyltransferase n=1 Tax=Granulicella aggregans TaxID=474949 RepID=UPI0021E07584|nr:GNAT family N-acetyltransferase [Granulicella aggregans]
MFELGTDSYTPAMFEIRLATPGDAQLIGQQRRQMFLDAGQPDDEVMAAMEQAFVPWVRTKIAEDRYIGWLASEDGVVVGGAGLWLMEFPPHFLDPAPVRAYLLNFYTAAEFRGRGLAKTLLARCVEEARVRGCEVVTLHASKFGKPIYEKYGFKQTNEMMLLFNPRKGDKTVSASDKTAS